MGNIRMRSKNGIIIRPIGAVEELGKKRISILRIISKARIDSPHVIIMLSFLRRLEMIKNTPYGRNDQKKKMRANMIEEGFPSIHGRTEIVKPAKRIEYRIIFIPLSIFII